MRVQASPVRSRGPRWTCCWCPVLLSSGVLASQLAAGYLLRDTCLVDGSWVPCCSTSQVADAAGDSGSSLLVGRTTAQYFLPQTGAFVTRTHYRAGEAWRPRLAAAAATAASVEAMEGTGSWEETREGVDGPVSSPEKPAQKRCGRGHGQTSNACATVSRLASMACRLSGPSGSRLVFVACLPGCDLGRLASPQYKTFGRQWEGTSTLPLGGKKGRRREKNNRKHEEQSHHT